MNTKYPLSIEEAAQRLGVPVETLSSMGFWDGPRFTYHVRTGTKRYAEDEIALWASIYEEKKVPRPVVKIEWDLTYPQHISGYGESVVYAIQDLVTGRIKVGTTKGLHSRLAIFKMHSPGGLRLVAALRGGVHLENRVHELFSHLKVHGEWFEGTSVLLAFLRSIAAFELDTAAKSVRNGSCSASQNPNNGEEL